MTVGQRIAQKRKELGLSQEALGERLGVSRQAIYKWESDAALPEIEKLVNLSREFSVSIDWLLGQEDETRESRDLTPEQLRMVEEIVERYLAAQPKPAPTLPGPEADSETGAQGVRWLKRWGLSWAGLAALVVIVMVIFNLFGRLDQMKQDYYNLQTSIQQVNQSVNSQINSITSQVENILESQNRLTAEQSAEAASFDYPANTVTISVRAVPRTYVEGMTAEFVLASGGETVTVPAREEENQAFTAEITGPLTDDITVSVVFLTGDQRETQVVERFDWLYSSSVPAVSISSGETLRHGRDGWTVEQDVDVLAYSSGDGNPMELDIRLGLFRERELVAWYDPVKRPNMTGELYEFTLKEEVRLEPGVRYCLAALVEDEYGRTWMFPDRAWVIQEGDNTSAWSVDSFDWSRDPADWDY